MDEKEEEYAELDAIRNFCRQCSINGGGFDIEKCQFKNECPLWWYRGGIDWRKANDK